MRISDWSSDVCSSDLVNGETDEEIRAALANFEPSRSGLILALAGWQEETRPVCDLDDESLHRLIEEEIGGFLKLTMARYDREARQEFSDQLIIELAEVPLSPVAPALAEARRKLAYPERLVPRSEEHTSELQSLLRIS